MPLILNMLKRNLKLLGGFIGNGEPPLCTRLLCVGTMPSNYFSSLLSFHFLPFRVGRLQKKKSRPSCQLRFLPQTNKHRGTGVLYDSEKSEQGIAPSSSLSLRLLFLWLLDLQCVFQKCCSSGLRNTQKLFLTFGRRRRPYSSVG